jgi:hypothetical protein
MFTYFSTNISTILDTSPYFDTFNFTFYIYSTITFANKHTASHSSSYFKPNSHSNFSTILHTTSHFNTYNDILAHDVTLCFFFTIKLAYIFHTTDNLPINLAFNHSHTSTIDNDIS